MATRRYLNFDLLLEQEGEGRYQARVTASPLGETPSVRFQLPFDATTLENLLLKLDPGRSGTRRVGRTGQQQAAMDFGGPLYQAVFTGDLALAWQRSLDKARAEQAGGLRLRLRLNDAGAIAGLPWELLYDARSNTFLAQSERTPLVRFLDVPQVARPMAVDGPLRVLAIISSPIDLDELDVEAEWVRIQEALEPRTSTGLVTLDRLPSATLSELGTWLRRSETHVVHFIGHGDFDPGLREGVIYFQDQTGRRSAVTSSTLGPYLRDHDPLRMVVLNACRSARTDSTDPFGGMAQGLVQQDSTAVVAMQFPISDRAAVKFTGEFYGALVDGQPVDQAVSSARKSLLDGFQDEWATPVLFMRSPDGHIFENVHAARSVVPLEPDEVRLDPPDETPPDEEPATVTPGGTDLLGWVRSNVAVVAAIVGVLVVVVAAFVLLPGLGGDDSDGEGDAGDVTEKPLPKGRALSDSQLLVAAGDERNELHVFLFDETTGQVGAEALTKGEHVNEWLPVLSPDRRTMIYSREREGGHQLRTAAAIDGQGDRALFDESSLKPCGRSTGRPAWIPDTSGTEELVMRCFGNDKGIRIVRVDVNGKFLQTYDKVEPGGQRQFGDPTVSHDGTTAVYFANTVPKTRDGSLFMVDLATGDPGRLLEPTPEFSSYSDAVFSPTTNMLAWRATTVPSDGAEDAGFEVLAAPLVDGELDLDQLVRVSGGAPGNDQDPMFSPDGTRIIYGHSPPDDPTTTDVNEPDVIQELWIASVANPDDRHKISGDTHTFYAVPAWSRR
ncbi:MAG TPA: CHAT domain-containing protein [Nocardioides sp.]|nr:CHAT domain-containing protein [Nocardioides sp.]